jgi:hypothetical protein
MNVATSLKRLRTPGSSDKLSARYLEILPPAKGLRLVPRRRCQPVLFYNCGIEVLTAYRSYVYLCCTRWYMDACTILTILEYKQLFGTRETMVQLCPNLKHHAMKTHVGVAVKLHTFRTLVGGWVGPRAGLDAETRRKMNGQLWLSKIYERSG